MSEKVKERSLIPADLNDGQKEAYVQIRSFLEDFISSDMYLLEGFAGTGKTFLVSKILRYIKDKHPNWRVAVTAPTNKAVKVLMRSGNMNDPKIKFQTIHKMLGLKEQITADGRQVFVKDTYEKGSIEDYHVVVIDEVSMLNDDLFQEVEQYSGQIKIIFMGDPAQIPPVGKDDCIPFKEDMRKKYGIRRYLLTEVMRQTEGNPILKAGFSMREDLTNPSSPVAKVTELNEDGHGIDFVNFGNPEDRQRLSLLLEEYFVSKDFKSNADYAKVIAWRNKTINRMNSIIRHLIYKDMDLAKIMNGEKLVANKPIMDKFNVMLFTTNDEFEVESYDVLTRNVATDSLTVPLQYYNADVVYYDLRGGRQSRKIDILHEDSRGDFDRMLKSLKSDALTKKGYDAKKAWVKYYEFMRQFADVGYNYAITCHKAQGSTYRNVFILEDDIDANLNVFERNRIKYTAYTRPVEKLFMVRS